MSAAQVRYARSYCKSHYTRWYWQSRAHVLCKIDGCNTRAHTRGWCETHYVRWQTTGDPTTPRPPRPARIAKVKATCSISGCDTHVYARGWCSKHYQRWEDHGDANYARPVPVCKVDDCDTPARVLGWCTKHYQRYVKWGEPLPSEDLKRQLKPPPPRSVWVNSHGYLKTWCDDRKKSVGVHRLVMEEYLGRHLVDDENVHHRNGTRSDNRLSNLELWVKKQPPGQRVLDQVAWAREILARYGTEVEQLVLLDSGDLDV